MIRFACESDELEMKELWHACFGDSFSYIDRFFSALFELENTLVYVKENRIASMLFLLPATLGGRNAYYLYAACTHPDFRGVGCMGELIERAAAVAEQRGIFSIALMPAEKSLFDYYERHGFVSLFSQKNFLLSRCELSALSCGEAERRICSAKEIFRMRTLMFPNAMHWRLSHIAYAVNETVSGGGSVLVGKSGYAFAVSFGERVYVKETGFSPENFGECAGLLLQTFPQREFLFSVPSDWSLPANCRYSEAFNGMLRRVGKGELPHGAYLGLALD